MNSQQLGKFFIPEELVRNNPEIVAEAFRDMQFVPVRVEMHFMHKEIEYAGISPKFGTVAKGVLIPTYIISIIVNQAEGEEPEYSHVEVDSIPPNCSAGMSSMYGSKALSDEVSGD